MTNITLGIISSKGGHLVEILRLENCLKHHKRFWITFNGKDVNYHLKNEERVYFAKFPESRNALSFIFNFVLAFFIFFKEKPRFLISCGAGIAVPFFIVGKIFFRTKLVYIESFDFIKYPSMTGKILYKWSDLFLIQHKCQKKWYPKAIYAGSLL